MFTGTLATLTKGEALLEMMMTMEYDALGIGNHEFDYGVEPLKKVFLKYLFLYLEQISFIKTQVKFSVDLILS